ncbi:MAG TPA: YiiD C-terminal domain-containing protein [Pseudomonadales bacterium]|nr:YiiD C-terminal domain-containing protein [Pseudomonadales bacterium]
MNSSPELEALGSTWHGEIPLTAAMGLEPLTFDGETLVIGADLAPNVNVHGTAFAGSLYAIAALSGWGLVHLCLQRAGVDGSIVIADGHIRYLKPVAERIEARCTMPGELLAAALEDLAGPSGKARLPLHAVIEADGRVAAEFDGVYAVKRRPAPQDSGR